MSKVVYVLGAFPLLSETFVLNQLAYLVQRGHEVKIVSMNYSDSGVSHPWVKSYGLMDKVEYLYRKRSKIHKLSRVAKKVVEDIASGNLKVLSLLFKIKPAAYLLEGHLKDSDRVAVCHFGPVGALVASLKEFEVLNDLKIVTFFHGADMSVYEELEKNMSSYRALFRYGDVMLPISAFWKKKIMGLGCKEEKIDVHRMGVEVDKFKYETRYVSRGQRKDSINLISVCRFVEKKGLFVLLDSLALLDDRYILTLVGEGPLTVDLRRHAANLGLQDRVSFTGAISSDKVQTLLGGADAFVLPSITSKNGDMEGIPVALMEAMASGLLVFSSFHSGIPELIENDVSGFLVPEGDYKLLSEKIDYAFEILDGEDRQRIVNEARGVVETSFNIAVLNERLVELIKDLTPEIETDVSRGGSQPLA